MSWAHSCVLLVCNILSTVTTFPHPVSVQTQLVVIWVQEGLANYTYVLTLLVTTHMSRYTPNVQGGASQNSKTGCAGLAGGCPCPPSLLLSPSLSHFPTL